MGYRCKNLSSNICPTLKQFNFAKALKKKLKVPIGRNAITFEIKDMADKEYNMYIYVSMVIGRRYIAKLYIGIYKGSLIPNV